MSRPLKKYNNFSPSFQMQYDVHFGLVKGFILTIKSASMVQQAAATIEQANVSQVPDSEFFF
jgi:hypothetical protein